MRKGNALKKVVAGVGVMGLLLGISPVLYASAEDYAYSNTFNPPFAGCNKWEKVREADGKAAYVSPAGSSANTTYVLFAGTSSDVKDRATNYVKTGSKGKVNFEYLSSYGGSGTSYRMSYHPTNTDFLSYYVSGVWKP